MSICADSGTLLKTQARTLGVVIMGFSCRYGVLVPDEFADLFGYGCVAVRVEFGYLFL